MTRESGRARRVAGDEGAALVEFAFVLPVLVLFMFGIIQFGLAYDRKQNLNSAVREGARLASLPTSTVDQVQQRVIDSLAGVNFDTTPVKADVVVKRGATTGAPTDRMCQGFSGQTVTVTLGVDNLIAIPLMGPRTVTITGIGVFTCE